MKQTAVEWLINMLVIENEVTLKGENYKLFEQAKAMEKEQMGKTFKQAQECAIKYDGVYFKYESFEQYYNKNFKSK